MLKKIIIPSEIAETEFTVQKSKFISLVYPVQDEQEVRGHLKRLRQEYPGATHVVWASVLGDLGTLYGLSDDGEPHGTAGRPVLEVLKGSGITYIALFVIRYFGGTKLGTGGLVSAYTQAAKNVLDGLKTEEKLNYSNVSLLCSYGQFESIKAILLDVEAKDIREEFSENVVMMCLVPEKNVDNCRDLIQEYSSGRVDLVVQDCDSN
ncbi:YigZ family protein [Oceanispirochaeta crateris]|uniref:YigZ family protein n=1 Tax=Oceanispirochaeta crateris TaxID=2518645 RepID=A0A5C1QLW5_9SPIO|nr:YigZ family protein [Oceanispirochaeta crateris]QEN09063.1 YigZ family protein [Oceanispirochaeta crateris]